MAWNIKGPKSLTRHGMDYFFNFLFLLITRIYHFNKLLNSILINKKYIFKEFYFLNESIGLNLD